MKPAAHFVLAAWIVGLSCVHAESGPSLTVRPREMLAASVRFSDGYWDESAGLLWSAATGEQRKAHRVRESVWYALGLLMRREAGDDARAIRIIDTVLSHQLTAPGQPWDGTFRRAPEEPLPEAGAELWQNFDPNWRQFIGTTLALMLEQHDEQLPAGLKQRMTDAICHAVEGELTEGRAEPYHTNVKLMHGFLVGWAGRRLGRSEWTDRGERWIGEIHAQFARHQTFEEYNSPTYYGVDFYGLALCRRYGATELIRQAATEMEEDLWRDVGRFYHAGLRNMCGPFDRAYGLDMRRYVSLTGIWMGLVLPADQTPLPSPERPMDHAHDFLAAPLYVALGARIPAEVLAGLRQFEGERTLERGITPERTATAWLGRDIMIGGEVTQRTRDAGPTTRYQQFVPASIHWRIGTADVGAVALRRCPPVDARASAQQLAITTERGDATFRIEAPGLVPGDFGLSHWRLPNLDVEIATDALEISLEQGAGFVEVAYRNATRFNIRVQRGP